MNDEKGPGTGPNPLEGYDVTVTFMPGIGKVAIIQAMPTTAHRSGTGSPLRAASRRGLAGPSGSLSGAGRGWE